MHDTIIYFYIYYITFTFNNTFTPITQQNSNII